MSGISMYNLTNDELQEYSNNAKDAFIDQLVKDKVVTKEIGEEMCKYIILVKKKNMFGKFFEKLFSTEDGYLTWLVVKAIK